MGYIIETAVSREWINKSYACLVAEKTINDAQKNEIRNYIASNLSAVAQSLDNMTFSPPTDWVSRRNAPYSAEHLAMHRVLAKSFADVSFFYLDKKQEEYLPFMTSYRPGQDAMDLANNRAKMAISMGFRTAVLISLPDKFGKLQTDCLLARFHAELNDRDRQLDHLIVSYISSGAMHNGFADLPIDGGTLSQYLYPLCTTIYLAECLRKAVGMGYCTALLPGHLLLISTRHTEQVSDDVEKIVAHLTTSLRLEVNEKDIRTGALSHFSCFYNSDGRAFVMLS